MSFDDETDDLLGELRLEGRLLDDGGRPVVGARVWIAPGDRETKSDDSGVFAFDRLTERMYRFWARKGALYTHAVLVGVREGREPVIVRMRSGATLRVRVVGEDGQPIRNATAILDDEVAAGSDEDGNLVVPGLGDQFQCVVVEAAGHAPAQVSMWRSAGPGGLIERTVTLRPGAPVGGQVVGPADTPVPGATILAESVDSKWFGQCRSDEAGRWAFAALAAGRYRVRALSKTLCPSTRTFEVDGRAERSDIVISMEEGARVVGSVVDEHNAGAEGAFVLVVADDPTEPVRGRGQGKADGGFEVSGLEPGDYHVFAHVGSRASPKLRVTLARNERAEVRLRLQPAALAGTVVDANGQPAAAVVVSTRADRLSGDVTDSQGWFDLGAFPPGEYVVVASRRDGLVCRETVRAGADNLRIVFPETGGLSGRVLLDGAPLPRFGILCGDCIKYPHAGRPTEIRDDDGRFRVEGLPPGRHGIVLAGPGTARKTIADIEVQANVITDLGDIQIPRGQRIHGCVRDAAGRPIAGAQVTIGLGLHDDDPVRRWFQGTWETTSDPNGAYVIDGIDPQRSPGTRPSALAATHPDHGASIPIRIPEGDDVGVDLVLVPTGAVDGVIEGCGASFAGVTLERRGEPADNRLASVNRLGEFHFEDVPPADYTVSMIPLPKQPAAPPVQVRVVAGRRTVAKLELP